MSENKLFIYNTMTRKKEEFKPLIAGQVSMYVCGPTVYDFLHVGNFFGAIFFNIVRNWLEKKGYKVTFVYNYTDIDDKIIQRSLKDGVASSEISEKYIKEFEKDYETLKLKKHSHNPKVTEFLPQIITFIKELVTNEHAYVLDGDVYYDVTKFSEYGKLSNKNIDELMAGTRVNINEQKKHVVDFALWKASKPGEPSWDSPWGPGRPGWHIECSCMAHTLLGETIDIHGGGLDLIFPHHENEIAQSQAATGKPLANYWMHNGFVKINSEKMSKSLGNIFSVREILNKYHPEVVRLFMLQSHYRSPVDFSENSLAEARSALARCYATLQLQTEALDRPVPSNNLSKKKTSAKEENYTNILEELKEKFDAALDDDFNTAQALGYVFEAVRHMNNFLVAEQKATTLHKSIMLQTSKKVFAHFGAVLGILQDDPDHYFRCDKEKESRKRGLNIEEIENLIKERQAARAAKDWARADAIRDELTKLRIIVKDSNNTTSWIIE